MRFVDLHNTAENLCLLERFYAELFVPGFPDPDERESLETLAENLVKVEAGFYGRNSYHILLGLDESDRPVAAAIADYLYESNCGAIEYILVDERRRGEGLGRAIHDHVVEILDRDARAAGRERLDAVMIEVNDPYRAPPELDNADAFERLMMWHKWGYQRLRFPYEQPALSEEQAAIDYLLLAVKVLNPALADGFPSALARQMVIDYLVWANRFAAFETDPYYRAMNRYAEATRLAPLQRLDRYIGRDPALRLDCRDASDPAAEAFAEILAVHRRGFSRGETGIEPNAFRKRLQTQRPAHAVHHLWGLAAAENAPVAGMASFFALPGLGFLDELILEPPLHGQELARVALQRIEERLFRDRSDTARLYVECDRHSPREAAFKALGFADTGADYAQPALDILLGHAAPMALLVKPLGDPPIAPPLSADDLARDLSTIRAAIYPAT